MLLTAVAGFLVAISLNLFLYRLMQGRGNTIVRLYRTVLLLLAGLGLVAEALGSELNPYLVMLCFTFGLAFLTLETLAAGFWGKIGYGSLTVAHLFLGGYLYTMTQVPYGDRPFAALSANQPKPLSDADFREEWIAGLPLGSAAGTSVPTAPTPAGTPPRPADNVRISLSWSDVEPLMAHDSHVRDVLIALREKQERDLSEMLASLNQIAVNSTGMRRHAVHRDNVENLLHDGAISEARYHTILETWRLTDRDEQAFRSKQAEELFHVMLQLLEDREVDETHKVELIDFMVDRFSSDVRLVKPLINLYEALDSEYPRQKRLNHEFLSLYLQKRNAILRGFARIGQPGLQPLLDYRKKTISEIRYSQARLDRFLEQTFGQRVRPLYGPVEPIAVKDFLNREKYPPLGKLSGAAYEQDYLRHSLIRIGLENRVPAAGQPVMGLAAADYAKIVQAFEEGLPDAVDAMVIDENPAVRGNLAWYLAERKDPYTLPLIFELMQDSHPEVRRLAAIAVGNFKIIDMQSANDRKFTEIVRMLVNYRTNADTFARVFALYALATVGDRQKALYVLDLIFNDGATVHSVMGQAAPAWKSEEEKAAVQSLIEILGETPEEPYVKTEALKVLLAMESQESVGILLHYLNHIYESTHGRPSLLRYVVPHMTLPQEAENVEDVVDYLAARYRANPEHLQQPLKALRAYLGSAYGNHRSGEFFQFLKFLAAYDSREYEAYLKQTQEHVLLMRMLEYVKSTYGFWLVFWPLSLLILIVVQYGLGLSPRFARADGGGAATRPNRRANPAADIRNRRQAPAAAVVPIKIGSGKS
ncbi:PBS lyase HEAT-like repeat domain protein [Methylococcus capsulatus str. Bath]|uniref:PBS lyase HEAT-like repeat domain protein n=1 Tax=Methylococcus capsulatus (strain ATCC 33009 / NCIMB 11132 / Bath) TaxID=243233 RepID=Q60C26_METCA|nr:HEAT repeat domain-containing protein [Methylococcus capsulatus]AAU90484.1 PBS lyase HEAT-like repeat domain protein [Methylococcus capsulatus str. Bath]